MIAAGPFVNAREPGGGKSLRLARPTGYARSMDLAQRTDRIISATTLRRNVFNMVPEGASRILDFGCGQGGLILRLKRDKACTDLHGLEVHPGDADGLEGLIDQVWRVDYEKGQALPQEFAGYFNYVLLHDVVEHFFDPWVTLSRIRELLAPGGTMIVATPNIHYWLLQYEILHGRFPYGPGFWHTGHLRWFTPASLVELLVIAGLNLETLYLDIPDKVSLLRSALGRAVTEVRFPPEELAHLHPDKAPVTVRYARDIRKYFPVFFAGKLIAACTRGTPPFELTRVTYNCGYLEGMRQKLNLGYDIFNPPPMRPLIGTSL